MVYHPVRRHETWSVDGVTRNVGRQIRTSEGLRAVALICDDAAADDNSNNSNNNNNNNNNKNNNNITDSGTPTQT